MKSSSIVMIYKTIYYVNSKIIYILNIILTINLKSITKINSVLKSMIINSRFIETSNDMMYNLMKVMLVIDHDLDIFQMNNADVNEYYQNNLDIS